MKTLLLIALSLTCIATAPSQSTGPGSSTGATGSTANPAAPASVAAAPTLATALTAQSAEELFRQLDINHDGTISREEFTRGWNLLQAARAAAAPAGGTVGSGSGPTNR